MKRSDMVKIIADELKILLSSNLCKYADSDADRILRYIEEEGMLPPTSKEGKWIDCGNGQGFVSYNFWDKEVEE